MMYAGREAIKKAKALCIDEDKVLSDIGSDVADFVKRFKISDTNELDRIAGDAAEAAKTKVYREVDLIKANGENVGEFDVVDIPNKLFIEDKSAQGLYIPLPAGATRLTPLEWAEKQIFDKTTTRIEKLRGEAVATRAKKDGTAVVPKLSEFIDFKKLTFRIDADTPELRQAVETCLVKLRKDFPDFTFDAIFGG